MAKLNLDETDELRFTHRARGYGVEVYGGKPEDRLTVLKKYLDEPHAVIDARNIDSQSEFVEDAVSSVHGEELEDNTIYGSIDLVRGLNETGSSIIIQEFDSMDFATQKAVAQTMKGVAEQLDNDEVMLGYTCREAGSVVTAEGDLRSRVHSWELA
jgi:hypothetical protein